MVHPKGADKSEWRNPPTAGRLVYRIDSKLARRRRVVIKKGMYFVYVLQSTTKKFRYVGMTDNLTRRLQQHLNGMSKTTRRFLPIELMYTEEYSTRTEARSREKFFKSGIGREFLDSIT